MKVIIVGYPHISIDIKITISDKNTTIVNHHLSSSISINCHQSTTKTSIIIINLSTYHRSTVKSCWNGNGETKQCWGVHRRLRPLAAFSNQWLTNQPTKQSLFMIDHNIHGIQSRTTWLPLMVVL